MVINLKKTLYILIFTIICICFASCAKETVKPENISVSAPPIAEAVEKETVIYIGRGNSFDKYTVLCAENFSADILIKKMAELTGWDLSLSEDVISSENEFHINFSEQSSVGTGEAPLAKDEFIIKEKDDLIATILDSVCKTLQSNFTDKNPDNSENTKVTYSCEGAPVSVGSGIILTDVAYSSKAVEKYNDAQFMEFLANQLSNYYDSSQTLYERTGEKYNNGKLLYIYNAKDKSNSEIFGTYGVTSDLLALYEIDGENMELILDFADYRN